MKFDKCIIITSDKLEQSSASFFTDTIFHINKKVLICGKNMQKLKNIILECHWLEICHGLYGGEIKICIAVFRAEQ